MINNGMMTSDRDDWRTPRALFDRLDSVFHFDLDVAASAENALCARYYTREDSAIGAEWDWRGSMAWCNPPYGREIGRWVDACRTAPIPAVMLIPARTDARWWQDNVPHAEHICFLRGRLRFDDGKNSAPFPSALLVFGRPLSRGELAGLADLGWWVRP